MDEDDGYDNIFCYTLEGKLLWRIKQAPIDIGGTARNPYDDVKIFKDDLEQIIQICKYILDNKLLRGYEEPDEGNQMLKALLELAQKAKITIYI